MTIYQEEMQRKAQRYGCITDYDEADQLLLISHKGVHLTAVNPEGFMFYNSKELTDPESREVFSHLVDDAETVREYVGLYESSPQMKPKDVQNYRKLSEYGDVVFAGMYSQKHGLDELNYLAKRMESFFGTEEEQFYEAMKQEGFTELKDLINLSFNLNKYCLIQNIGNMGKIGQEYLLNRDGAIPANDDANPKYAEIGRRLMQSGTGIVTEHGILFVDEDIPFQELYDGQVFPPYLYDASILCTAKAEYQGKVEYLYLPCERAAIDKSIGRLGAPDADSVSIILDDFMVDNPEWMRRLREMTSSESIYDINDLVGAISNADMQLDKLTAVAEYAGVEDAKSITALANSLGLFTLVEDAEDHEDVGKHFVEHDPEYSVSETIEDFVNYDLLGEHIADELNGLFVSSGFVCMESGYAALR